MLDCELLDLRCLACNVVVFLLVAFREQTDGSRSRDKQRRWDPLSNRLKTVNGLECAAIRKEFPTSLMNQSCFWEGPSVVRCVTLPQPGFEYRHALDHMMSRHTMPSDAAWTNSARSQSCSVL